MPRPTKKTSKTGEILNAITADAPAALTIIEAIKFLLSQKAARVGNYDPVTAATAMQHHDALSAVSIPTATATEAQPTA